MTMQLAIVLIIAAGVLNGLLLAWAVARAADDDVVREDEGEYESKKRRC